MSRWDAVSDVDYYQEGNSPGCDSVRCGRCGGAIPWDPKRDGQPPAWQLRTCDECHHEMMARAVEKADHKEGAA